MCVLYSLSGCGFGKLNVCVRCLFDACSEKCVSVCVCVVRLVNILHSVWIDSWHRDTWSCLTVSGLCGTPLRGLLDSLTHTHTHTEYKKYTFAAWLQVFLLKHGYQFSHIRNNKKLWSCTYAWLFVFLNEPLHKNVSIYKCPNLSFLTTTKNRDWYFIQTPVLCYYSTNMALFKQKSNI